MADFQKKDFFSVDYNMSDNFEPQFLLLGCGYTLERLAKSLPIDSFLATVRSRERAHTLGRMGIHYQQCDIENRASIREIIEKYPSLRVIVDSIPPIAGENESAWTSGVRNIISSLENSRIERIIYLSTSGVFGASNGTAVDEKTVCNPDNPKSQARLACENIYRKSGIPSVSLRIVGIYGPGRGLGISIKHNRPMDVSSLERWTNRIHVEDLARFINWLLLAPLNLDLPDVLCVCDDEPAPLGQVLEHYCSLLSIDFSEFIRRKDTVQSRRHSRGNLNQRIKNRLIRDLTGLELKYPSYREGAGTEFSAESDQ